MAFLRFKPSRVAFHFLIERSAENHGLEKREATAESVIETQEHSGNYDAAREHGPFHATLSRFHPLRPFDQIVAGHRILSDENITSVHVLRTFSSASRKAASASKPGS